MAADQSTHQAPQPKGSAPLPLTDASVVAAARVLCKRVAVACNIDVDDNWKTYGDMYLEDARQALGAALSVQAAGPPVDPTDRPLLQPEAADVDLSKHLRESAAEVESFPHPSQCDHLHVAFKVMREAADWIDGAETRTALSIEPWRAKLAEQCGKTLAALASRAPAPEDFDWVPIVEAARAEGYARGRMDEHNEVEARSPAQAPEPFAWVVTWPDGDQDLRWERPAPDAESVHYPEGPARVDPLFLAALAHRATAQAPEQPVHLTERVGSLPDAADGDSGKGSGR